VRSGFGAFHDISRFKRGYLRGDAPDYTAPDLRRLKRAALICETIHLDVVQSGE
jgi:hypothetical protein